MKKLTASATIIIAVLMLFTALEVQAATIWIPNASGVKDVNYSYLYTPPSGSDTSSPMQFAIFDDTGDLADTSAHLILNRAGVPGPLYATYGLYSASDTIHFSPDGNGDWTILSTFTNNSITLKDSNHFRLAYWDGTAWVSDAYFTDKAPWSATGNSGSNTLYFNDSSSLLVWLDQVDAIPSSSVPVPAAIYLLGAGLLACIGFKKQG